MNVTQRDVLKQIVRAIVESVKEMGAEGAPSGPLYAALMTVGVTLEQYTTIIGTLKQMGVLHESSHVLYFVKEST